MQTTGYSLVLLSSEQQNARRILGKLAQCLHNGAWQTRAGIDLDWLETAFNKLVMVDRYCHERKIERYVIPAVRNASTDTDFLLEKLDALSVEAWRILRYAYDQIQRAMDGSEIDLEMLIASMELYCLRMLERLALEEDELFPIASRLLSNEEWLRLAARCLSEGGMPRSACRHGYAVGARDRWHRRFCYVH